MSRGGGHQNLNVVATIAYLILLLLASPITGDPIHLDLIRSIQGGGNLSQTPMILPLVLSYPNSSRNWRAEYGTKKRFSRRHLQKAGASDADAARMRLYDDLLANGCVCDWSCFFFFLLLSFLFIFLDLRFGGVLLDWDFFL